jgi:hypothetical protein
MYKAHEIEYERKMVAATIACNLLNFGMKKTTISQITNLELEYINNLNRYITGK